MVGETMVRTWLLDKTGSVPSSSARGAALDRYISFSPTSPSLIWNTPTLKEEKKKEGKNRLVIPPPLANQSSSPPPQLSNIPMRERGRKLKRWHFVQKKNNLLTESNGCNKCFEDF